MRPLKSIPILLIMLLSACTLNQDQNALIQGDVYYNDNPVATYSMGAMLTDMQKYLMDETSVAEVANPDLVYELILHTPDGQFRYSLLFNIKNKKAAASGHKGTFFIPFDWLTDFLNDYPIPEAFPYLTPPEFSLTVNDYQLATEAAGNWILHPVPDVDYRISFSAGHSENYKSTSKDLIIEGTFTGSSPDRLNLAILGIEGGSTYEDIDLDALPVPDKDGAYRYELTAIWDDPAKGYEGAITYSFGLSVSKPVSFQLNKSTFLPGECMAILIKNPKDLDYKVKTETYGKTIGLFYLEKDLVGLIPLDPDTAPGSYSLDIYRSTSDLPLTSLAYEVAHYAFPKQNLTVTGSASTLKSDENRQKDAEKFKDARTTSLGEKLWEGTFLQPVEGRISTEYAVARYVNGSSSYYRHSALDIAAPLGTPVYATNNGIVTFASDLIISGNTIVIDHGYGLFSNYNHLDEIYVEPGQRVKKGSLIAAVGTTGYSTGPHLHWSIWKNGVFLNPWKLMEEDPLANFN